MDDDSHSDLLSKKIPALQVNISLIRQRLCLIKLTLSKEKSTLLGKALDSKWIAGFSLLGGDPFEPEHEAVLAGLLERIKERFPDKTVWAWTGRTFKHVEKSRLLPYIDRLVDGAYVQKLHLEKQGAWRGSSNQRIIPLYQGRIDESPAAQAEAAAAEAEH